LKAKIFLPKAKIEDIKNNSSFNLKPEIPFEMTAMQLKYLNQNEEDMLPYSLSNNPGIERPPTPKKPFVMPD